MTDAINLVGVSIPRSGHGHLARLLQRALGTRLFYCNWYLSPSCCQSLPCQRRKVYEIVFQKNHDLDLTLSKELADTTYLIQYRDPVCAALSDRELYLRYDDTDRANDPTDFLVWLARKTYYINSFVYKWVLNPPASSILIDYDVLLSDPKAVLEKITHTTGIAISDECIEKAVRETINYRTLDRSVAFNPRKIEDSRFFNKDILAAFESILADRIPTFAIHRHFEAVEYSCSPLFSLYQAVEMVANGEKRAALVQLRELSQKEPSGNAIDQWLGELLQETGSTEEALHRLEACSARRPRDLALHLHIIEILRNRGNTASAIVHARTVLNQRGSPPDAIRVALLLTENNQCDEARKLVDNHDDWGEIVPQDWRGIAEVYHLIGAHEQALAAITLALTQNPTIAEWNYFAALHHTVVAQEEKALAAYRLAITLAPGVSIYRVPYIELLARLKRLPQALRAVQDACQCFPGDEGLLSLLYHLARQEGSTHAGI